MITFCGGDMLTIKPEKLKSIAWENFMEFSFRFSSQVKTITALHHLS